MSVWDIFVYDLTKIQFGTDVQVCLNMESKAKAGSGIILFKIIKDAYLAMKRI